MFKLHAILKRRVSDNWGAGHFGAGRGGRTHKGIDFVCPVATIICSNVDGTVTKLGYPYGDDLSYRYVQITDENKNNHRYFYVEPSVEVGQEISVGDELGKTQCLGKRYDGISEHVHYEVKDVEGEYVDPDKFWSD